MSKRMIAGIVAVVGAIAGSSSWASVVLYDSSVAGLPQTQGWLAYQSLTGTATTSLAPGGTGPTKLDTTGGASAPLEEAGFSNYSQTPTPALVNPAFPALSPTTGFDLSFGLKLDAETHSSNDRAGFDVILLGNNLSGIELGFWTDQIFAQSTTPTLFTHGESTTSFDPTLFHQYDLAILGTTYTLSADGSQILTGSTRNYSTYPLPAGLPYRLPNFVFLGDDTTSAQGAAEISSITVSVPEPISMTGIIGGAMLLRRRRAKAAM